LWSDTRTFILFYVVPTDQATLSTQ